MQTLDKQLANVTTDESKMKLNWSGIHGELPTFNILNYPNLVEVDITGCVGIVPDEFVDVIGYASSLKILKLNGCNQFTQYHMVKLFDQLVQLEEISLVQCQRMPFTAAYCICSGLKNLRYIDLEPANIQEEMKDWKRMLAIFFYVQFGPVFKSALSIN